MRKLTAILVWLLVLVAVTPALAEAPPIKLIVNGEAIATDVAPVNIDGRVYVPARYVAEALGATVEWDNANNAVVITSKEATAVNTSVPTEPVVQTVEVKPAKVGDTLQFANMSVTVTDITLAQEWDEFVASEGEVFAIVTLSVVTGDIPVDPLRHPVSLVQRFYLASGATITSRFSPTTTDRLWPNQTIETQVGASIPDTENLVAVRVASPYPEDRWTQYQVELD